MCLPNTVMENRLNTGIEILWSSLAKLKMIIFIDRFHSQHLSIGCH